MLREQQIDLRRQRARAGRFDIENLGKNRVYSQFRVTNSDTGGQYTVRVRGFEVGDNTCTCPDFRSNTLRTCKHIEAVVEHLRQKYPAQVQKKKAVVTHPEIGLDYGEQLRLRLWLPPRHSDQLRRLRLAYFDEQGLWSGRGCYRDLIRDVETVPEHVHFHSDALDFVDREIERAEMLAREQDWLRQLEAGTFDRDLLRTPLYDYQIRGAVFLACRGRSILGDDMGLGKTVQTLAAVEILARERGVRKVLVVAPASVKYQWEAEILKFTTRTVQVIEGGPDDRRDQYAHDTFYRLVNYEQVVRDHDAINDWNPDVIVLDEAQRIKNWESKTSQAVKKLHSRYAIVLTGTPLENRLEELYSIVQFVDERRFGPAFQFLHDHRILDERGNLKGYRNLEAVRERLAPIFLRRTRAEVLSQLPPRTDSTIYVELAPEQRGPYEEQRATLARLLQNRYLTELDRKRILACVANLRLICNSLFLFDHQSRVSPKLDEFAELIPDLTGPAEAPHKVVVFSQWETMTREAAAVLDRLGIGYTVLHGGLSGQERRDALRRFHDDPRCQVFLSTDAGGTGLNLQVADTVVNLELPWNPAVLEQRIARVHRMGQSRPVRVVNFVTRGTIEERVLRALEAKRELFAGVFTGEADEIAFTAVNTDGFLGAVRELVAEEDPARREPRPPADTSRSALPDSPPSGLPTVSFGASFWLGFVHLVEGATVALTDPAARSLVPADVRDRLRAAVHGLARVLHGEAGRVSSTGLGTGSQDGPRTAV